MASSIAVTDNSHLSVWQVGDPPAPGHYRLLVDIDIHDNGKPSRSERREYWDGKRWGTLGAYARPVKWAPISST